LLAGLHLGQGIPEPYKGDDPVIIAKRLTLSDARASLRRVDSG